MNCKKILALLVCLTTILASCKKYLDVNPKSSISEEALFSSETGFQQALDGVYSLFASRALFGDNLSMGFESALAQNYSIPTANTFYDTSNLNLTSAEVAGFGNDIWSNGYNAIAGANKVIQNTQDKRNVLSDQAYGRIRGEALALRAYMHFELLRLFGPEYVAGQNNKAIPYKTAVNQYTVIPSTTQVVVQKALADLKEAEQLLSNSDPILTGDVTRRIKMNYYAVKALEARIYLFSGDKNNAFAAAKTVVNANKFPFVSFNAATADASSRDRLYITEQIFGLRVANLRNWADQSYFRGASSMRRSLSDYQTLYETASGGSTDIRYLARIETDNSVSNSGGNVFCSKFWQTYPGTSPTDDRLDEIVPMLRLSEMYYILAECAPSTVDGVNYLNMVRQNRNLTALAGNITQAALSSEITKEYQKEFHAEGQLFFYYKRKNVVRMQFKTSDISLSQYVLPIPDSELEFNPNYK
ncbi:RagB/SusD family nutrient uptake outer membrane protein [Mucilaginibacter sp. RS28]|uniref:RagB/SusD family nutrient uptake outer membrane protein n=1 Tax=Mucilaginibacter straminoryzae TaxID=2932774 RepID=A0A9X1X2M8_9SPHI|nr:RagB/SusD family nutrient uptake outer membrane protein [Mucilaginibacter straminoryzae]MCJ8209210.1 RagB/SusD family nutrient uptake outer membrane protein [Mucilaginibacter straminoryzae]